MSVTNGHDPITLFETWLADAERAEPVNPDAAALATATPEGAPSARMVLLKGVDERGFTFYTNLESRKAVELEANPRAALCFYWKALGRQVRVEGTVSLIDEEEADAYFASRPRGAQIGAWASKQSRPLAGRLELEKRAARYAAKFHVGTIPRPEFWSGFRLWPHLIEFWSEQKFRLHDRIVYHRTDEGWTVQRLYP